jgi:hypothetical protein
MWIATLTIVCARPVRVWFTSGERPVPVPIEIPLNASVALPARIPPDLMGK